MMRHWLIKFTCGDAPIDQTPHQLLKAAATVNRIVHEELVEQSFRIAEDDPDRRHTILTLKMEYIQAPRKDRDRFMGYTEKEVKERARDRLRRAVNLVVKQGGIPERTVKGPATIPRMADRKQKRRDSQKKRKANLHAREDKLKILSRLSVWYSHFIFEWLDTLKPEDSDSIQASFLAPRDSQAFLDARIELWTAMSMKLDREGDRFSNAMCLEPVPAGAWSEEGEALSSSYLPCCRALFHHGRCGSYECYSCDAPEANE